MPGDCAKGRLPRVDVSGPVAVTVGVDVKRCELSKW